MHQIKNTTINGGCGGMVSGILLTALWTAWWYFL